MRNPRAFFEPLAAGAPPPPASVPARPYRMIHFFPPQLEKVRAKIPEIIPQVDVLLANLEDAIPSTDKDAARKGLIEVAKNNDFGSTSFWTRINSLDSPWVLDDLFTIIPEAGDKLDVIMVPKVEGPWDIHYVDRLLAQLEAKHGLKKSLMVHAILETALGVSNVEEICAASPRMQGISLGPADLAASRRMKTTRVGGGHPSYQVIADPDAHNPEAARVSAQQDPWHYTLARMVDACNSAGILPFYGPFGAIEDPVACQFQFRAAFLMGCVGTWTLHPSQIEIARREFSPTAEEVNTAKRIIEAMGDGTGTVMLDGRMQDDATFKQAQVMVQTAKMIAERDPEYAKLYGF
ncbi:MAG TPA: CoA ester lyase [Dehalococcoidia bacterium]|nr:CoA ester lyase [Dehalococcoidia bacterium]